MSDIRILSGGAPKLGVSKCAEDFKAAAGHSIDIRFATAPVLRAEVEGGASDADVIIAPEPLFEDFQRDGRIVPDIRVRVGGIKTAVVMRVGADLPDLSGVEAFKAALLAAPALVYNQASSGQYIERMLAGLGIAEAVADKSIRTPTGAAVIETIARDAPVGAIGFGQMTEIRRLAGLGVMLAGPLPDELSNTTTFVAGVSANARSADTAREFADYLASPAARRSLVELGIE
jgi:molybdate transport system substrate-binding protein